ncbi:AcrR family transcriptional regulator [Kitasatospora sp. MAA4]|uniref:TetR/AcrR family transcriptional regulator n=1 Tax=Kitasatospora sp. MAA4 TaxID=3035093 RepID=UPI00247594DD|nr:helix-turn-helix domain-containing protein [Kitasatospora sp. MAA4]MDH6135010.1 AcrR family transcriptional regulator [Kitasatospora sp. MAA4]
MTAQQAGQDSPRPLRADARRNRARLLEVAEAVFTARGTGVSTEEIAREAGVGVGTLFRHFPTKEALLEAVLLRRLERLAEAAEQLAATKAPGDAFFTFFALVVDQSPAKNVFADALSAAGVDVRQTTSEIGRTLHQAMAALLTEAQRANAVRADLGVPELTALLVGTCRMVEHLGSDSDARERTFAVIADGLRASGS